MHKRIHHPCQYSSYVFMRKECKMTLWECWQDFFEVTDYSFRVLIKIPRKTYQVHPFEILKKGDFPNLNPNFIWSNPFMYTWESNPHTDYKRRQSNFLGKWFSHPVYLILLWFINPIIARVCWKKIKRRGVHKSFHISYSSTRSLKSNSHCWNQVQKLWELPCSSST